MICATSALLKPSTFKEIGAKVEQKCQKSCTITEYIANTLNKYPITFLKAWKLPLPTNNSLALSYTFGKKEMDVKQEYLIYDIITMIGSVGGTLGLFIGFSFLTCISSIIKKMKHVVNMVDNYLKNRQKKYEIPMDEECHQGWRPSGKKTKYPDTLQK